MVSLGNSIGQRHETGAISARLVVVYRRWELVAAVSSVYASIVLQVTFDGLAPLR
jgi:hypothetical protein